MIEIRDLYKYYGDRRAVGPLSFTIEAGEIVGLLGLNGAGKTTTLRILACDLLPSSGTVLVDGLDVVDNPHEVRSRIGYLPDRPPLYDEMTPRDFLAFAAKLRGMDGSTAEKRVPEVLEMTELGGVADDAISSLSHGFKQRVGIAQAIVHKPRLLVLDEPISGLDPVQIVEMRRLLRNLKGELTILLSSHILSEISETSDRILVIRDGTIGAQGTPEELSTKLLEGVRFEITVVGGSVAVGSAAEVLRSVEGVLAVEPTSSTEPGEARAFRVEASRDVRAALVSTLVARGLGVVDLRRSERELETVFLRLSAGTGRAGAEEGALPPTPPSGGATPQRKKEKREASEAETTKAETRRAKSEAEAKKTEAEAKKAKDEEDEGEST
ncbi:ABC transporter ATP-binding protein [Chondromyces apiculatus]|uniref:ABC transporter, ATP-binding protein n=1 Tax=Chondromyces apiculatus DSM 436 TaxID=1192034 RepID=A0A017T7S7_9BACT|nr:ABC transporter ATP-binding protein [Chondromyces apiculatus]EYF05294.1 ABC transporter, ATP-binding protein [Chondromyces apiculatus DSM 436]